MRNPIQQDSGIYQVVGPPGTGKTTFLTDTVQVILTEGVLCAGEVTPVTPEDLTIVAFTRAAALNAMQRLEACGLFIPAENIGTIHSLTLRAMTEHREQAGQEKPRLFGDPRSASLWNERYPDDAVSVQTEDEESVSKATEGDKRFTALDGLRARLTDPADFPEHLRDLHARYEEFKLDEGYVDFTDLIVAAVDLQLYPKGLGVMLADEAQDFSPLEWKLLNIWAQTIDRSVFIGDDDQAIYGGLKGASPENFVNLDVPDHHRLVLSQSYRVPALAHALAECITDRVQTRLPKTYKPRAHTGTLRYTPSTWMNPYPMLPNLKKLTGSVMILAYSKFMLEPTLAMLRDHLIPFHNPFRPSYGAWNPLGQDHAAGTTIRTRLKAFMKPEWTTADVLLWMPVLAAKGVFPRGMRDRMKADLETLPEDQVPDLRAYFETDALAALQARDLAFFAAHTAKKAQNARFKMCLKLAEQGLLDAEPQIIVGTFHSVKGGEADTVIMYPDYPDGAANAENLDENLRVMYVGATRTLDTLVIATAARARGTEDLHEELALPTQALITRARARHAAQGTLPASA